MIINTNTNLLRDTVTSDCLDTLVKRLDNKVLENMVWNGSYVFIKITILSKIHLNTIALLSSR